MFGKNKDEEQDFERKEPAAATQDKPAVKETQSGPVARKRETSVIGPTLRFRGELSANEDLIIEGQIEGTIAHQDKNLTVGKEGRVKANINARTVEIYGQVEGDINGEDVVKLAKSSHVEGNVRCARIIMEDGAHFTGNIEMTEKARSSSEPTALPVAGHNKQIDSAG